MGKFYDALRKAESERKAKAGTEAPPPAQEPAAEVPIPPREEPAIHRPERRMPGLGQRLVDQIREKGRAGRPPFRQMSIFTHDSPIAEQYRSIRARIDLLAREHPLQVVTVTSAIPGEGKTTTAVNLAFVMSLNPDKKVLLVDCDLRKPQIHRALRLGQVAGLADLLNREASLDTVLNGTAVDRLSVIPGGAPPYNPSELLSSGTMRDLITKLRDRFDTIILDTPAAIPLADPAIMSDLSDAVLLVVRAGKTPRHVIERAIEIVSKEKILGLVLNDVRELTEETKYYY